jgi:hypothetical protein
MRKLRPVYYMIARGVVMLFYSNVLMFIKSCTGYDIWNRRNWLLIIICGVSAVFFLGGRLSRDYNANNNDNKLFHGVFIFLFITFIAMAVMSPRSA